ncbi:transglutaminaseTgpA domain-containing protein [Microbacterium sp. AGC85]
MSPADPPRVQRAPWVEAAAAAERQMRTLAIALLTACAAFVALWPYAAVIAPGPWSLVCITVVVLIASVGALARHLASRRRAGDAWALLAQLAVAVCALTLMLVPQGALLGIVPTGSTLRALAPLAAQALEEVQFGTAPLNDTLALRTMIAAGFAVITIIVDHLIAHRLGLLAAIVVAVVGVTPMIISFGDANVPWFVVLAVLTLFLLRHSTRHDARRARRASVGVALGVGVAAIVAALVITPVLPVSASWVGAGTAVTLNPSLRLGDDLRRPAPTDVLTVATSAATAPYLRIATLSGFDGRVWQADEEGTRPLADGFGEAEWTEDISVTDRRTSIRVVGISSSWLPVPYPATQVAGTSSGWEIMPGNRTVVSETRDAAGEDYTVSAASVQPTLEQIRAAAAGRGPADRPAPDDLPSVIEERAREVTADAENDYDRMIALQSWFRSDFTYSLDAPVDGGFDGTGADAVAEFLEVRSGYCIHFAGAFALMAQTLDLPVRIVVGYLPGRLTEEKRGDEFVYVVSSDQLHAWPEVRFEGIGWVPFEPTASLGVPTGFQAASVDGGSTGGPATPAPSAAPSTAPTSGPELEDELDDPSAAGGGSLQRLDPTPVVLVIAGTLVLLLLPASIRLLVRMRRRSRAGSGDAAAAWRELTATLIDLGLPVSDSDSPRARGSGVVERGADAAAVRRLVDAVERASFAREAQDPIDLAPDLVRVSADLHRHVDARTRVMALLLPRSLVVADTSRRPMRA